MILDYITKIKANIAIHTNIKATSILDGSYKSVFMGKSLNFEDLREYIPGDNIRDIDWKASSRSRMLLVKRYIAEKKHNILLVFDSGIKIRRYPRRRCGLHLRRHDDGGRKSYNSSQYQRRERR